jgi:hypothetical protein
MWSNMYKAYEERSAPLRDLCDGLSALHDADPHGKPEMMTVHPVVRVHPETGRRSLFVNEHFTRRIVEPSHEESDLLLGYLTRWVSNPRFSVRYCWSKGTVAMWDNRCTQHFVLNDFDEERIIQRATVMGDRPQAAGPPRWPAPRRRRHEPPRPAAERASGSGCRAGPRASRRPTVVLATDSPSPLSQQATARVDRTTRRRGDRARVPHILLIADLLKALWSYPDFDPPELLSLDKYPGCCLLGRCRPFL